MRFVSSSSAWLGLLLLTACASNAPPLPKDYGSVNAIKPSLAQFAAEDVKLSCDEVDAQLEALHEQETAINKEIASQRGRNQTAGYLAAILVLPALAAADFHGDERDALEILNKRRDALLKLEVAKDCRD